MDPAHLNIEAGTDATLIAKAMGAVMAHVEVNLPEGAEKPFYNVKLVWFCKTLQNWKALLITTLEDQRYYEVTYNGDKKEMYLDVYDKAENLRLPDEEE